MTVIPAGTGSECSRPTCFAPDTPCILGLDEGCDALATSPADADETYESSGRALPWSGLALGLSDLFPIVATARPHIIGIVGAAGAGKTTLLAAHWVAARRGIGSYGRGFAGSYTLSGWHQIARHLQWIPWGSGFPPHTSAVNERSPALLHFGLNSPGQPPKQLLYTDAPGEWFTQWAEEPGEAEGARWVADHADAFVLLADSDALSGPNRGVARAEYESLANQLATAAQERPVVPVLAKADIPVPGPIASFLTNLNKRLFGQETVLVSVKSNAFRPITAPIDQGVEAALAGRFAGTYENGDEWARQLAPEITSKCRQ